MALKILENILLEKAYPTEPKHLVTREWVEQFMQGKIKDPVRVVDTSPESAWDYLLATQTLTALTNGEYVVDDIALSVNNRVLISAESTIAGIYVVTDVGSASTPAVLTRASDFNASEQIYPGLRVTVIAGTENANTEWQLMTSGEIILDETVLLFEKKEITVPEVPAGTVKKYADTIIGDAISSEFEIEHGLGTTDITITIKEVSTGDIVLTAINISDVDNVVVSFGEAPAVNENYRVIIMG